MAGRQPPPNFKTDVHRNVTQKWQGARNVAYDGDDWGGYDDYGDEYAEPPPPMPPIQTAAAAASKPTGLRQRGQASLRQPETAGASAAPPAAGGRPNQQQQQQQQPSTSASLNRTSSFDYGDDSRDFSAGQRRGMAQTHSPGSKPGPASHSPAPASQHPRNSGPAAAAAESRSAESAAAYQQRSPPTITTSQHGSNVATREYDHGASSQTRAVPTLNYPQEEDNSAQTPDDTPQPLFIRPADIYKRMEAAKDPARHSSESATRSTGASMDGGRSSASHGTDFHDAPLEMDAGPVLTSGSLGDARGGYGLDGLPIREESANKPLLSAIPLLPNLDRFSTFGTDMWSSSFSEPSELSGVSQVSGPAPAGAVSHRASMGFRSAVERAFDQEGDSTLSPTGPPALDGEKSSDLSREDSAAGLSPIMSGAPGTSAGGLNSHERTVAQSQNPVPANPPSEPTPRLVSASTAPVTPHSRNISAESGASYRRSLDLPSADNSPAKHAALAQNSALQSPREVELAVTSPIDEQPPSGAKSDFPMARDAPLADTAAKLRQDSGSSIASWASSKRSASPIKTTTEETSAPVPSTDGAALRPHLPGEWVSYATTATSETEVATPLADPTQDQARPKNAETENDDIPDFSPSASTSAPSGVPGSGPMAALASAGAAIAASLSQVASGSGATGERDFAEPSSTDAQHASSSAKPRAALGDINSYAPQRSSLEPPGVSSGTSSFAPTPSILSPIGPTPPPKDTPLTETINRVSGYFPAPPAPLKGRDNSGASASANANASASQQPQLYRPEEPIAEEHLQRGSVEFESDRLNAEIERSLVSSGFETASTDDHALASAPTNTDDSQGRQLSDVPATTPPRSGMLAKRFSWEADEESTPAAAAVQPAATSAEQTPSKPPPSYNESPPQSATRASVDSLRKSQDVEPAPRHSLSIFPPVKTSVEAPRNDATRQSSEVGTSSVAFSKPSTADASDSRPAYVHPAPLKELMLLKSPAQRIDKYDLIRHQYVSMHTGLDDWLSHMVTAHPEHERGAKDAPHLTVDSSSGLAGSVRNKISPAMSKLTNMATGSGSGPHSLQYLPNASSTAASGSNGSPATASSSDPNFKGRQPSTSKGKDLFGSIGGKASHSAKGLFAKGRSKLRAASSEKAHAPSASQSSQSPSSNTKRMSRFFSRSTSQGNITTIPYESTAEDPTKAPSTTIPIAPAPAASQPSPPAPYNSSANTRAASAERLDMLASPAEMTMQEAARLDADYATPRNDSAVPASLDYSEHNDSDILSRPPNPRFAQSEAEEGSGRDSFHSARHSQSRQNSTAELEPIASNTSLNNVVSPLSESSVEARAFRFPPPPIPEQTTMSPTPSSNILSPTVLNDTTFSPADDSHRGLDGAEESSFEKEVSNQSGKDVSLSRLQEDETVDVIVAQPVVRETTRHEIHHIVTNNITRDIHYHDYHQVFQPVQDVQVLPIKHFDPSEEPARLVDVSSPTSEQSSPKKGKGEAMLPSFATTDFASSPDRLQDQNALLVKGKDRQSEPEDTKRETEDRSPELRTTPEPQTTPELQTTPKVIARREGPSIHSFSRPFANAHSSEAEPLQPRHNRSLSTPAPPPNAVDPSVSLPPSLAIRPVPHSTPSQDEAFAKAATNRASYAGHEVYPQSASSLPHARVPRDGWYPTNPSSRKFVDARAYDTEYSIPGLGPDSSSPEVSNAPPESRDPEPKGKAKHESKVRNIVGRLRARSRSRSRAGREEAHPEQVPTSLPTQQPVQRPRRERPVTSSYTHVGPTTTVTTTTVTRPTTAVKEPSPTRVDPRLAGQAFVVSPEADFLEDGRRPSLMHDEDPLPKQDVPKMDKKEEAELRKTLRRRRDSGGARAGADQKERNRKSWFGGMFGGSAARAPATSSGPPATSFGPPAAVLYSDEAPVDAETKYQGYTSLVPDAAPQISRFPSQFGKRSDFAEMLAGHHDGAAESNLGQPERRATNRLTKAPPKTQRSKREQQKQRPVSMFVTSSEQQHSPIDARSRNISMSEHDPALATTQRDDIYGVQRHPMAGPSTSWTPERDPSLPNVVPAVQESEIEDESMVHPAHRKSLPPAITQQHAPDTIPSPGSNREEYVRYMQAQGFFPERAPPERQRPQRYSRERSYGVPGWERPDSGFDGQEGAAPAQR